jgi:hypothetical protein
VADKFLFQPIFSLQVLGVLYDKFHANDRENFHRDCQLFCSSGKEMVPKFEKAFLSWSYVSEVVNFLLNRPASKPEKETKCQGIIRQASTLYQLKSHPSLYAPHPSMGLPTYYHPIHHRCRDPKAKRHPSRD